MSTRTSLALPIDVARVFDATVSTTQITSDTFQNSTDDTDLLYSYIEDAEDEFRSLTDNSMRVSRVGVAGQRETYEQVTYDASGHNAYKRNYTGVTSDYEFEEVTTSLAQGRILPFDSTLGDQAYFYRGLSGQTGSGGDQWEDVTSEIGNSWDIINYADGRVVFTPSELWKAQHATTHGISLTGAGRQRELRFAISYRYGGLGGSRASATETTLDTALTTGDTGATAVGDGSGFPIGNNSGSIIVLIGEEYLEVVPDPANDSMDIISRGVRGTTASSHSSGDRVVYTPPSVRKAVASRAGMQLITSGRYSEWLPDTDDTIDKSEMSDMLEATWDRTIKALS